MTRSKLSIFLFVCFLSLTAFAQQQPTLNEADKKQRVSLGVDDLIGPVHIVAVQETQLTFTSSSSAPSESVHRTHVQSVVFDMNGKVTEIVGAGRVSGFRCGTESSGETKHTERFDLLGRKIEERNDLMDSVGKLILRTIQGYEYDEQGRTRVYKVVMLDAQGLILFKWEKKFDELGRVVLKTDYDQYGLLRSKEALIRDDKGRVIESIEYSSRGVVNRTAMSYEKEDDIGNWTICTHSKLVTENGESYLKPVKKVYRTLTYYPPQLPK